MNILIIQDQEEPCYDISGSFLAVDKAVIAGKSEAVFSGQVKYIRY